LRRLLIILLVFIYATVAPALAGQINDVKLENKINHLRIKHDLRPYNSNSKLQKVAQRRSSRLAEIHKLKHSPNLKKRLRPALAVGEILGVGTTWRGVYRTLKHSPEHRGVMLSRTFTQQGAGLTRDKRGRLWVVVVFRKPA